MSQNHYYEIIFINDLYQKSVSVTANGTKTYATLLNELFAKVSTIPNNSKRESDFSLTLGLSIFPCTSVASTFFYFTRTYFSGTATIVDQIYIAASSSSFKRASSFNSWTIQDLSNEKPANGTVFYFYY